MTTFDKICAAPAAILGGLFLLLGVFGLFAGASAHFSLPPVLGVIPAFIGWGILRAIYIAWQAPAAAADEPANDPLEWLDPTGSPGR